MVVFPGTTFRRKVVRMVKLRIARQGGWCRWWGVDRRLSLFLILCILLIAFSLGIFTVLEVRPLADCPAVPPFLQGSLIVSPIPLRLTEDRVEAHVGPLGPGGSWRPTHCNPRHSVAIIIPYRDRWEHLMTLLYNLHPLLKRQQLQYRVFVVEQAGNDMFNKGMLMNAGFLTVLKQPGVKFHCFVFHDVDMLPEDDRNMYSCPVRPRHMSVAVNEFGYKLPYRQLVGGVFAIKTEHFIKVNGYSNLYWGWGGEDIDMGYRVYRVLSYISRPSKEIARYTMIKHQKRRPLPWKVREKLLRTCKRRYRRDGLNTVQFSLLNTTEHALYTRLLVDVGHPPQNIRVLQQQQDSEDRRTTASGGIQLPNPCANQTWVVTRAYWWTRGIRHRTPAYCSSSRQIDSWLTTQVNGFKSYAMEESHRLVSFSTGNE